MKQIKIFMIIGIWLSLVAVTQGHAPGPAQHFFAETARSSIAQESNAGDTVKSTPQITLPQSGEAPGQTSQGTTTEPGVSQAPDGLLPSASQVAAETLWERGNAHYVAEEYQQAIVAYRQILALGQVSARLWFNLGNACYKAGDINHAILYYERAKLLAPRDEDINFNLQLANQFVVTSIDALPQPFFVRWRNRVINLYPADSWGLISLGSFLLFLTLLGLFLFSSRPALKKLAFWIGILAIIAAGASFSFAARQKERLNQRKGAIVFCPRVTVKSAPSPTSTDLFLLYEGVKVELSDSVLRWKEIRLPDGNIGWMPDSCLVRI